MILGYGQPVELPTMSVFDKPMMQMYILALLKDYEQGVAEQKEFLSNFGNFTSPIAADVDYWNSLTVDPLREYLNLNPDALRSVEGRNALSRFIATRPYGDFAKLRQSAENAKAYLKAYGEMLRNGQLSPEMARVLDGDLSKWSTLGENSNGIWNITSPTKYMSIDDMLQNTLEDLRVNGYDIIDRSRPGVVVKKVSDNSIDKALNKDVDDLMTMPLMKYYKDKLGMNNDLFRKYLHNHLRADLADKEEEDKAYFDMLQLGIAKANLGINQAKLAIEKQNADTARLKAYLDAGYTMDEQGRLVKPENAIPTGTVPLTKHQEADMSSVSSRNIFLGGGSKGGNPENFNKRLDEYIKYYSERKADKNLSKVAQQRINWAMRVKKEGFKNAVKNGLFTRNEYGDYIPTKAWNNAYTKVQTNALVTKPKYNEAVNRSVSYRNTYKHDLPDAATKNQDAEVFTGVTSGGISKNINPGDGIRNRKVSLSINDIEFTQHRALKYAGSKGNFRDTSVNLAYEFNKFVHKNDITGYFTDESYSKMQRVSAPRSNGGRSYEVDAPVLINKQDIAEFAKSIGRANDIDAVAKQLGIIPVDIQTKTIITSGKNTGKQAWQRATYYKADFTRIENNNNTNTAGARDTATDELRFGKSNAYKLTINRQAGSAERQ